MCCSYVGEETCTRGQVWAPLLPASKVIQPPNLEVHETCRSSTRISIFIALSISVAEKLRAKRWKKIRKSLNWIGLGPISRLRERSCKNPTTKSFECILWTIVNANILRDHNPVFQIIWKSRPQSEKLEYMMDSLGAPVPVRDRTTIFCSHRDRCGL